MSDFLNTFINFFGLSGVNITNFWLFVISIELFIIIIKKGGKK